MTNSLRKYVYGVVARQVSRYTRYYDSVTQLDRLPWDDSFLFDNLVCPAKRSESLDSVPSVSPEERGAFLINGNLNYSYNIQEYLERLYAKCSSKSRVVCVIYNSYLAGVYSLFSRLGLRKGDVPRSFITQVDLENIFNLAGFAICYESNMILFPFKLFGLGDVINRILHAIPLVNSLSLLTTVVLRPIKKSRDRSVSILIPARNEKGNIENALKRIPDLGLPVEVVFVEGNSRDGTWEEILRVVEIDEYRDKFALQWIQQPGKGKYDAVKAGFAIAKNDILVILDADLTMTPELLPQFINAYLEGKGEFINGSRLVYPMEGEAMRFLNKIGNIFFTKLLSFLLDVKLSDTLCGTKVVSRRDYQRIIKWREDFGDFDPFGDFELLFSAADLKLGIVNVPVRYRDRLYGSTQINRLRDGLILLKMSIIAFFKIKLLKM